MNYYNYVRTTYSLYMNDHNYQVFTKFAFNMNYCIHTFKSEWVKYIQAYMSIVWIRNMN